MRLAHGFAHGSLGVLMAGMLSGCFFGSNESSSSTWIKRLRPGNMPQGADLVYLDMATLERPWGDDYLDGPVWAGIDEQVLTSEKKALLEENGMRVGIVSGIVPPELQAMLTSERFCINPRRSHLRLGTSHLANLGERKLTCELKVQPHLDAEKKSFTFQTAQLAIQITPSTQSDGRLRLHIVPQVQHGEKAHWAAVNVGGTNSWALNNQRPTEKYEDLGFDAMVGLNEYLVIGTRRQRKDSFGFHSFADPQARNPVQRILVIRTGQTQPNTGQVAADDAGDKPINMLMLPLASQATTSVRGQKP